MVYLSRQDWINTEQIGNSLYDEAGAKIVEKLVEKAKSKNVKLYFPLDYVTADKFDKNATTGYATNEQGIPDGWMVRGRGDGWLPGFLICDAW